MDLPEWVMYGLVLVAAAAHAGWNAILKLSGDQLLTLFGLRLVGLIVAVILLFLVPSPSTSSLPYLIGNVGFMYCQRQAPKSPIWRDKMSPDWLVKIDVVGC